MDLLGPGFLQNVLRQQSNIEFSASRHVTVLQALPTTTTTTMYYKAFDDRVWTSRAQGHQDDLDINITAPNTSMAHSRSQRVVPRQRTRSQGGLDPDVPYPSSFSYAFNQGYPYDLCRQPRHVQRAVCKCC